MSVSFVCMSRVACLLSVAHVCSSLPPHAWADRDYEAGEEVLLPYGLETSADLVCSHGIVLAENEADYVPVYTFASQQPPHVPAPIKKIAPAIEVVEELQDPSLGWFTTP